MLGGTAPGGFLLGAVVSSLLSQRFWWPWSFGPSFACPLLMSWACSRFLPPQPQEPQSESSSPVSMSMWGVRHRCSRPRPFQFCLEPGPVVAWTTPYTYFIIGILVFTVFVLIEKRASLPLIPFGVCASIPSSLWPASAQASPALAFSSLRAEPPQGPRGSSAPSHLQK